MANLRAFIKNHTKGEKVTQVLTVVCETDDGKDKIYKDYFVNVSKEKGTAYLTECKKVGK